MRARRPHRPSRTSQTPHQSGLHLARRLEHPRFRRVETFSPRNHLHQFRLERLQDVDEEVAAWLAEAYQVGEQRHLRP